MKFDADKYFDERDLQVKFDRIKEVAKEEGFKVNDYRSIDYLAHRWFRFIESGGAESGCALCHCCCSHKERIVGTQAEMLAYEYKEFKSKQEYYSDLGLRINSEEAGEWQ
jgi:hypothetical protein